jgi:small conductance mechanosensitive channel
MNDLLLIVRDVALIFTLTTLGVIGVNVLSQRAIRVFGSSKEVDPERKQQLKTLIQSARWVLNVLIVGIAVLMLLSSFVDITPLLASVGVAGLAVSLGAQTLIKDIIGGFLILLENQYGIGDVIQVGDVSGTVERLSLRATQLRDISGSLHVVPNGEARIVSNLTKDWSRALVDVGVAYEEDLDRVLRVLEEVSTAFAQDPAFASDLLEPPQVVGPLSLGDWAVTLRVMVKTRPGKHWEISRQLQKRVLAACDKENVTLPYPRQEVWVRRPK